MNTYLLNSFDLIISLFELFVIKPETIQLFKNRSQISSPQAIKRFNYCWTNAFNWTLGTIGMSFKWQFYWINLLKKELLS